MTRHLILGGSGFIGRHVAAYLLRQKLDVVVADRRPFPFDGVPGTGAITFKTFDLASADWDTLISDCDVIHHYAWTTLPQTANENPAADLGSNVNSTIALLEAMRRSRGKILVFASSGGTVYGRLQQIPVSEDHPLNPITAYGVSKLAAEKYMGFYRALYGIDCRVARISNPFGAGQDPTRNQGAVTSFLQKALAREKIIIWGDGEVVRDYIHISDVTRALSLLACSEVATAPDLPVFNIGSGEGTSLNQVIKTLRRRLTHQIDVAYVASRPFDIPVSILDVKRAREVLGWHRALSFEQGIEVAIKDIQGGTPVTSRLFDKEGIN